MPLSLTQTFSSRALLLFLVSYLLLWKNVACTSDSVQRDENTNKALQRLFKLTSHMSNYIACQARTLFSEFDSQYAQGRNYNARIPGNCPTSFISTPESKEQVLKTNPAELLKLVYNILDSWINPLRHLANEMSSLQRQPSVILSKIRVIQEKNKELLEGVREILLQMGHTERVDYPVWTDLESLRSSNEEVRCFAFHTLVRCILRDSRRVNTYLEVLKYRLTQQNSC